LRHHRRHLFLIVGRRRTALAMMHGVSLSSRSVASYRRKVANAVDESEHSELASRTSSCQFGKHPSNSLGRMKIEPMQSLRLVVTTLSNH
jgi:hypothetical protein